MLCGCGGNEEVERTTTGELAAPDRHFNDSLDDSNCNFKDDENITS